MNRTIPCPSNRQPTNPVFLPGCTSEPFVNYLKTAK